MIACCLTASVVGSSSLVMMKCFGEIAYSPAIKESYIFATILCASGLAACATQVYFVNKSMMYFNNIDVMPIYQSIVMITWMLSGLVLLDESALYTWGELFQLAGCASLIILGIAVLALKQAELKAKEEGQDL